MSKLNPNLSKDVLIDEDKGSRCNCSYPPPQVIRAVNYDSIPDQMVSAKRLYCIEIQAGTDMSSFDPDLIQVARTCHDL
jgi:hypothetical protein